LPTLRSRRIRFALRIVSRLTRALPWLQDIG
jgi:hypothetical protein